MVFFAIAAVVSYFMAPSLLGALLVIGFVVTRAGNGWCLWRWIRHSAHHSLGNMMSDRSRLTQRHPWYRAGFRTNGTEPRAVSGMRAQTTRNERALSNLLGHQR